MTLDAKPTMEESRQKQKVNDFLISINSLHSNDYRNLYTSWRHGAPKHISSCKSVLRDACSLKKNNF